jgi:hypothetical protein
VQHEGGWSVPAFVAMWASTFLLWRTLALAVMIRPGFLASVPPLLLWLTWAIASPLAVLALLAELARTLGVSAPRGTRRIVFAVATTVGVASTLLLRAPLRPHPFPDLGGFLVASAAMVALFLASELRT